MDRFMDYVGVVLGRIRSLLTVRPYQVNNHVNTWLLTEGSQLHFTNICAMDRDSNTDLVTCFVFGWSSSFQSTTHRLMATRKPWKIASEHCHCFHFQNSSFFSVFGRLLRSSFGYEIVSVCLSSVTHVLWINSTSYRKSVRCSMCNAMIEVLLVCQQLRTFFHEQNAIQTTCNLCKSVPIE